MINEVFTELKVPVIIKINNRKILQGIAEVIGAPDRMIDIAVAIDKLDKIGHEGVKKELLEKGFSEVQTKKLNELFTLKRVQKKIGALDETFSTFLDSSFSDIMTNFSEYSESEIFKKGIEEVMNVYKPIKGLIGRSNINIELDLSLARGLNYYTGTIIEVQVDRDKCKSEFTSSICGGGRYDDLTGVFGKVQGFEKLSGVGISFGADRIYDVMEELGKFPADVTSTTKVLFMNFGDEYISTYLKEAGLLRNAGVSVEVYPDKINPERFDKERKKQFEYAEKKGIPYAIILGEKEMEEYKNGIINLKTIGGDTKKVPSADLIKHIL